MSVKHKTSTLKPHHLKTLDEVHKSAYSHGLESIYSIENIDLKTIRPLSSPVQTEPAVVKRKPKKTAESPQLEFAFNEFFVKNLPSTVPFEPVQVLGLSAHAERSLLENGKKTLKDLSETDFKSLVYIKGLGQGHIEEIKQKFHKYIEDKEFDRSSSINFQSWIKVILGNKDKKKSFLLLERYQLQDLVSLSPLETVELKKMTKEKRQELIEELMGEIYQAETKHFVEKAFLLAVEIYIRPWISLRGGFAHRQEIMELVQKKCCQPLRMENFFNFFSTLFYPKASLLESYLPCLDQLLFASAENKSQFLLSQKIAASYFYKKTIEYPLHQLVQFIERELCKGWKSIQAGLVEKTLRYSARFDVYKTSSGKLQIRLA